MSTLECKGLTKIYQDHRRALDNVTFSVETKGIFGLIGRNGAGKTTLIRLLLDIIKPDVGEIRVFGTPLNFAAKDRIGYLSEERGLYKKIKILDTLVYLAQLKGVSGKQAQLKAEFLLKSFELYDVQRQKGGRTI